jgi:hypothetical protein
MKNDEKEPGGVGFELELLIQRHPEMYLPLISSLKEHRSKDITVAMNTQSNPQVKFLITSKKKKQSLEN